MYASVSRAKNMLRAARAKQTKLSGSRPKAFPFHDWVAQASSGIIKPSTYTVKLDGFRFNVRTGEDGKNAYFTKNEHQIKVTETPGNILEAIVLYMDSMSPIIKPSNFLFDNRIPAWELNIEFTAHQQDGVSDLQALYHKLCLDSTTHRLDEVNFKYQATIFDARFREEGDVDYPYWQRLATIQESLGNGNQHFTLSEICDAEDAMDTLLNEEGLVAHSNDSVLKIKLPRYVMKARIIAVGDTTGLSNFNGFSRILFGVPSADGSWNVLHMSDFTELLTDFSRPGSGKAFIPPQSVKVKDGRVVCEGKFSLQPLVNALFQEISKATRLPPSKLSPKSATAQFAGVGRVNYSIGRNRSHTFEPGDQFLATEVNVTLGCSRLWELHNGEIHLQPAWILNVGNYGHEAYSEIEDHTPIEMLRKIAEEKPYTAYQMVGMRVGPFLGLEDKLRENMTDEKFFVY